ncbi:uncharacterized protein LOC135397921 isoform X2 [Ornithodoros turicata]|uniref:uncharacterized protein LOC135397921 isoform X2 n=1 Tax=Ornithodoros turicata TaxID=34597 RepID=UPI0031394D6A
MCVCVCYNEEEWLITSIIFASFSTGMRTSSRQRTFNELRRSMLQMLGKPEMLVSVVALSLMCTTLWTEAKGTHGSDDYDDDSYFAIGFSEQRELGKLARQQQILQAVRPTVHKIRKRFDEVRQLESELTSTKNSLISLIDRTIDFPERVRVGQQYTHLEHSLDETHKTVEHFARPSFLGATT